MLSIWFAVVGFVVAWVFGHTAWLGWKTGITKLPLSLFAIEEFERGESAHFWPLTALNTAVASLALAAAGFVSWSVVGGSSQPFDNIRVLDGCYKGEGMPDYMRPRDRPIAFRIKSGIIFDREGLAISAIRIVRSTSSATTISFSPSISVSTSTAGLKRLAVSVGSTATAQAYVRGERTYISVPHSLFPVHTTSCR